MNKLAASRLSSYRPTPLRRMLGVVLPMVLVVLTVLTGLVVTQIRRGTIDERLAANTRESVQMDSAVQTVLRWCEFAVTVAPQNVVAFNPDPNPMANPPLWDRLSANWAPASAANRLKFSGSPTALGLPNIAGAQAPSCVIENATCELAQPISPTGQSGGNPACPGNGDLDPRWRKFRITARVETPAPDLGGSRQMFSQSELRLFIE